VTAPMNIWEGVFRTWEEASGSSSAAESAFSSDRWIARMTQQLQDYRRERAVHFVALPPRPTNLPWLCATTRPRTILDFGGSSGWCWDYLHDVVQDLQLESYVIVETSAVVEQMQRSQLHGPPVFYTTDPAGLGVHDILYSNSVLQYFGTNAPILDLVAQVRPLYVLLDDLFANDDLDSFSTQVYYGVAMPHRFIGLAKLRDEMDHLGYVARLRAPFTYPIRGVVGPLPMENLPKEFRVKYASSVLFERKQGRGGHRDH
jgi:putative methyltransferase (TIGR04325 family)